MTLFNPMGHTVHGILQVRTLEWVAFPFSRGSSQPRDWTQVSCTAGRFWSWGVDAQEFPGGIPEAEHVLAFCQASFRMTLSQVGFLTLALDNLWFLRKSFWQNPISKTQLLKCWSSWFASFGQVAWNSKTGIEGIPYNIISTVHRNCSSLWCKLTVTISLNFLKKEKNKLRLQK